uniref:VPS26 endosomal protein sorting factor C n=1 Tax=Serinus canaria TaxID=9135 RepID=A0A8C9N7A6_SERCA
MQTLIRHGRDLKITQCRDTSHCPIQIISSTIEMVKPGKLPSGKTEIPFEFPLQMKGNKVLYETYHGVFVNIQYTLRCDMRRSLLAKDLTKTCEFIVHSLSQKGKLLPSPVDFTITPETLQNVKERASLPKFLIRGHLNSTNCVITQPLTGELLVESAEAAVKSIELQLVRVETCEIWVKVLIFPSTFTQSEAEKYKYCWKGHEFYLVSRNIFKVALYCFSFSSMVFKYLEE